MTTAAALLGIDLGTSSVKVVLTDLSGGILAKATAAYPVVQANPGWSETDPELWWSALRDATAQVRAQCHRSPVAIGLSGQMHGLVVCDRQGRPLRPALLWSDSRAEEQLEAYRSLSADTRIRLGNPLSPGMAGPMLAWLAVHEPDTYRATAWALQPKDWIRARLTGLFAGEPSDASATLLYDVVTGNWSGDVVDALGLDATLLPPLLPCAGALAGELQPAAAAELDLPAGQPVAAGAADAAAAALGSGLVEPGTVQLTIGTGAQLVTPVPAPTYQQLAAAGAPVTHTYRAATATGWYAMGAILNGGLTLDWVRGTLGVRWAELYAAAESPPPPEGDPIFVPHLNGERTPHMDTRLTASWTGLTGRHDRASLLRSALEGVGFALADALDALPTNDSHTHGVRLAGGGSTSPGWRQLLADILNVRLFALDVPGASALGGAYTGALAAALITEPDLIASLHPELTLVAEPNPDRTAGHADRRARFRHVVAALRAGGASQ